MNKRNKKAKILLFVIFSETDTINLSLIQKKINLYRVPYYQICNYWIGSFDSNPKKWQNSTLTLNEPDLFFKNTLNYIPAFRFQKFDRYIQMHLIKSLWYEFGWTPCIFFTIIVYLCHDESSKNSFSRCTWSLESCNLDQRYLYHEI